MYKNFTRLAVFLSLFVLAAAVFMVYTQDGTVAVNRFVRPLQTAGSADPQAANAAPQNTAAAAEKIQGQIIYDARAALPPQAALDIKLTENDKDGQPAGGRIVAEEKLPLSGRSPLDWALPVALNSLKPDKSYNLQAKISGGDTLLFVNAAPTPIDRSRAAYIIRLAKLDGGANDKAVTDSIIGQNWVAQTLFGKAVEPQPEISFSLSEETKTDPTDAQKHYRFAGSGGCNRFTATAAIDENSKALHFSAPIGATLMACLPPILRQEANFTDMMAKTRAYRLDESGTLTLLDEKQNPLAAFAAR